MLNGFQNASRIPELRRRLLFTLGMLAVYRLGVHVPTPGIDRQAMAAFFDQQKNTLFGFLNLFSGGALEQFSVFSLGIMPYISASIILQLLTVVFPYLERLSKEGEIGRLFHDRFVHRNVGDVGERVLLRLHRFHFLDQFGRSRKGFSVAGGGLRGRGRLCGLSRDGGGRGRKRRDEREDDRNADQMAHG